MQKDGVAYGGCVQQESVVSKIGDSFFSMHAFVLKVMKDASCAGYELCVGVEEKDASGSRYFVNVIPEMTELAKSNLPPMFPVGEMVWYCDAKTYSVPEKAMDAFSVFRDAALLEKMGIG